MKIVPSQGRRKLMQLARSRPVVGLLAVLLALAFAAAGCAPASAPAPTSQPTSKPAAASTSAASPEAAAATTGYANPGLLVETDWLAQNLSDASIRLVDARKADDYKAGHIKGAVSIPQDTAFLPGAAQGILGSAEQIAKIFGDKGIGDNNRVVIYGAGATYDAPYLLWALEAYGKTNVAVLNGGIAKWKKENREVTTAETAVTPTTLATKADPTRRAVLVNVKNAVGNRQFAIVDSRSPQEFKGEQVNAKQGGHIPGAVNVDWVTLYNADGVMKSAADLAKLYESQKVTRDKQVIVHCQVGFRSAAGYLSLRLLGYNVAHYDASWNEWGNDTSLPVEK